MNKDIIYTLPQGILNWYDFKEGSHILCVYNNNSSIVELLQQNKGNMDYKTMLQEFFQKQSKQCPFYELVNTSGPDHNQTFFVSVHLGNKVFGPAEGKSKKAAEQNAAKLALDNLNNK